MEVPVPKYHELPELVDGYRCSWTYFNSISKTVNKKDNLGTLNFLTPERTAKASREEILEGVTIPLDLPIDHFAKDISAFGGRPAPKHSIKHVTAFCCEDAIDFNTQSASQWDGLRHFGIRTTGQFYNGYRREDFDDSDVIGTDAWVKRGSIFGRAMLIDFKAWFDSRGETIEANEGRGLTLADTLAVLEYQKSSIHPGDIIVVRTGWLHWYNNTSTSERHAELCLRNGPDQHRFIGMAQDEAFLAWLWENQIAAVAGDQVAFERTPPPATGKWFHEQLLGALGCPIGELWDTEQLAVECARKRRYSFFLASVPLYVVGGVASPANAVALM